MPPSAKALQALQEYAGTNPRPADFDAYWDRALSEMRAVDPAVELIPADFSVPFADCYHLYFTGVRGARIHAKYVRPKHVAGPHPAILKFHGYSSFSGEWGEKLTFAALGYSLFAMDCRGQGGLSVDTGGVKGNTHHGHIIRGLDGHPDDLLLRQIFLDTAQLASIAMAMPEVDPGRVVAAGGSQGGGLSLVCAALEPRIRKIAPMNPFLADYQRVWETDHAKDAYQELKTYFRYHDPRHEREAEIFTKLGYIDTQHLADRIRAEVLMGIGLIDTVCPPATQFAVYNKIASPKRVLTYPDFGHEGLPGFGDLSLQFLLDV